MKSVVVTLLIVLMSSYIIYDLAFKERKLTKTAEDKTKGSAEQNHANAKDSSFHTHVIDGDKSQHNSQGSDNHHSHSYDEEATSQHHQIPSDIKRELCLDDKDLEACVINTEIDFSAKLFNEENQLKTEEVGVLLGSVNFNEAISTMVEKRTSNETIEREYSYQSQLASITYDLALPNTTVECGDSACAIELSNLNDEKFTDFYKRFFSDSTKGNVFVSQNYAPNGKDLNHRILFFPNYSNGVTRREN